MAVKKKRGPISSGLFRCKPRPGLLSDARRDYGKECANNRDYGNESGANAVRREPWLITVTKPRMRFGGLRLLSDARSVTATTASIAAVTIPVRRRRSILLAVDLCRWRRRFILLAVDGRRRPLPSENLSIPSGALIAAILSSLRFSVLALHV